MDVWIKLFINVIGILRQGIDYYDSQWPISYRRCDFRRQCILL